MHALVAFTPMYIVWIPVSGRVASPPYAVMGTKSTVEEPVKASKEPIGFIKAPYKNSPKQPMGFIR